MTPLSGSDRRRGLELELVNNFFLELIEVLAGGSSLSVFLRISGRDCGRRCRGLALRSRKLRATLRDLQAMNRKLLITRLIVFIEFFDFRGTRLGVLLLDAFLQRFGE